MLPHIQAVSFYEYILGLALFNMDTQKIKNELNYTISEHDIVSTMLWSWQNTEKCCETCLWKV